MTQAHLTVLTGASRGMGAAIAEELLRDGQHLLCISRAARDGLHAIAAAHGATVEQWRADLADPAPVAKRLEAWLRARDGTAYASVALVNNAAAVARLVPFEASEAGDLVRVLRVGLEAPMLLTAAFLRGTHAWPARAAGACKVLNISSGLGRRAMASQAAYCAVKSGLDHFTRALALDEAASARGARVVSLAPGVIDTDMQSQIRAADPAHFPDHARFLELKSGGQLDSPLTAARKVIAYLRRADFGSHPVADVRDP